jgi:hypothetical protein
MAKAVDSSAQAAKTTGVIDQNTADAISNSSRAIGTAAQKYLNRCAKYTASPPDEKSWDNGVDNLTEK